MVLSSDLLRGPVEVESRATAGGNYNSYSMEVPPLDHRKDTALHREDMYNKT